MWTPRRVLIMVLGVAIFVVAYATYAHFLGGIDGLKPLPEEFGPVADSDGPGVLPPPPENSAIVKLRQAFGNECDEIKDARKIKLELASRGMVLSAGDFKILEDGRVQLWPFSLAVFRRAPGGDSYPEINTVQSSKALITFDKPVNNPAEMASRKIVAAALVGEVWLINNRHTASRADDISLFTQGPVEYHDSLRRIWTDAVVRLTDPDSKPRPMTIVGTGMDIALSRGIRNEAPRNGKAKAAAVDSAPVERIRLQKEVEMYLWVDARSGFLGAGGLGGQPRQRKPGGKQAEAKLRTVTPPAKAAAKAPTPAADATSQNSQVVIRTQGPFIYDVPQDKATFEISHIARAKPDVVTVERFNEIQDRLDSLSCDRLELQFRRKATAAAREAADTQKEGLDIEWARATGKEVVVLSDSEVLEAHGTDFHYDRRTRLTTLRGDPQMWALKDGHMIHASELQLLDNKDEPQATALGPGSISIFDKSNGHRPVEALWKQKLIYGRDGTHDLLTLLGDARFVDKDHNQQLRADTLKVWLQGSAQPPPRNGTAENSQRRPHLLEAVGQVQATSPEMFVREAERLVVRFRDEPIAPGPSRAAPAPSRSGPDSSAGPAVRLRGDLPGPEGNTRGAGAATVSRQRPAAKGRQPIELKARIILTNVVRSGSKNDLEKIWCEGTVQVHQEPNAPGEKGVDIRGDTLELSHHTDGNVLIVTGNHARIQMDKLFILGSVVHIDQTINEAWVNGRGAMRMPSKANFDGSPLVQEAELTVTWQKKMVFNGQEATFIGGVRAAQNQGRVACDGMQVVLDRKMSLREGNRGDQTAKVQKLVCEGDVWIEDSSRRGDRLTAYNRIQATYLLLDNDVDLGDTTVQATGPGQVRLFQLGSKGGMFGPPRSASKPGPAGQEFKLTDVSFDGKMIANNKRGSAKFFQQVVVVHVPATDPQLKVNPHSPPPESIRLSCEVLEILTRKLADNRTAKEMTASGKVVIDGAEFSGNADVVKFDEHKDQVILEGSPGKPAVLVRQESQGANRQMIKGLKILYALSTGEFHGEKIEIINIRR